MSTAAEKRQINPCIRTHLNPHQAYLSFFLSPSRTSTFKSSTKSQSHKKNRTNIAKLRNRELCVQILTVKMVWSAEAASKAYIRTLQSVKCGDFKESGVAEFLSAMAAGRNAKLIVESWSKGGSTTATSIGLAVAARLTGGRHVCIVADEGSRSEYVKSMHGAGMAEKETEVEVGEAEEVMARLVGVDFLVVDCKRRDFVRVLRFAKLSPKGAVLACNNAFQKSTSGFRWHGVLEKGTSVVRSVLLPVGQGLDIAYIGSSSGGVSSSRRGPSRWIKQVDQKTGEEHLFRG